MQLRADRGPKSVADGLEGIDGGMSRLIDALHDRLRTLGAGLRLSSPVDALERRDDGRWTVLLAAADAEEIDIADVVILAAGAEEAHRRAQGAERLAAVRRPVHRDERRLGEAALAGDADEHRCPEGGLGLVGAGDGAVERVEEEHERDR